MIALIDGDVVTYRTGWASEEETETIACVRANKTIEDILRETGATEYQVWLSDSLANNYRLKYNPEYKANRKDQPKPFHYESLRMFLTNEWGAAITPNQEADDILGIEQTTWLEVPHHKGQYETVICTIDKDLLQVPGLHFNFVKKEFFEQDQIGGLRSFYRQFLVGDRVDNIEGVSRIGPVKAGRLIDHLECEYDMFKTVQELYGDNDRLLKNGICLWVRREADQLWEFPKLSETELQDESRECGDPTDGHSIGGEDPDRSVL